MLMLNWPIIIFVTGLSYIFMILFLPFNVLYSTIILFGIISFWSRLPGVGMHSPFYVLYLLDFVDFFSLIIAINVGGLEGGIFSVITNMGSRFVGVTPSWLGVTKDSIAQFCTCLVIPYVHILLGGDIILSMVWYSVIRLIWFFPMRLLPVETTFSQFLVVLSTSGGALIVINAIYAKLFGDFLDNLMKAGAQFSFILFLFVTVVILIFYISVFGNSKIIGINRSLGYLARTVNKTIVKSVKSKKINNIKDDEMVDDDMKFVKQCLK
ncbi:MAG: hypothetical protein ACMXYG_03845 [Candidatus Woesearchaeota archaeon]